MECAHPSAIKLYRCLRGHFRPTLLIGTLAESQCICPSSRTLQVSPNTADSAASAYKRPYVSRRPRRGGSSTGRWEIMSSAPMLQGHPRARAEPLRLLGEHVRQRMNRSSQGCSSSAQISKPGFRLPPDHVSCLKEPSGLKKLSPKLTFMPPTASSIHDEGPRGLAAPLLRRITRGTVDRWRFIGGATAFHDTGR